MKVKILLGCLLAGAFCAQAAGADIEPKILQPCTTLPSKEEFVQNICYVKRDFDPRENAKYADYIAPSCRQATSAEAAELTQLKEQIARAYNIASDGLKNQLCRVDQVFITTDDSWGFWENPEYQDRRRRSYIAISREFLLTDDQTLSQSENEILDRLLNLASNWPTNPPRFGNVPNSQDHAVLGTLAHELAHVLFYARDVEDEDCYQQSFINASWDRNTIKRRRWVAFRDENNAVHKDLEKRRVSDIRKLIARNRFPLASRRIRRLFDDKGFVSVFASVSPEEDFVETFKYVALNTAQNSVLQSLTLEFPHGVGSLKPFDVLTSLDMYGKVQCFTSLNIAP